MRREPFDAGGWWKRYTHTIEIQHKYGTNMIQNTIERMRRRGHMMLVVGGRCGNRRPNKERAQVLLLLATDNHRSLYPRYVQTQIQTQIQI